MNSIARESTLSLEPIVPRTVITLLMHQVTDAPIHSAHGEDNLKQPWVTPEHFDALMSSLERRGYTIVPLHEALAIVGIGPPIDPAKIPAKPLLITFDDGYRSAFTTATPILRKHHATATMFFEGHLTGTTPERLTLADLRAMKASGVWTLASHGWAGHSPLRITADGPKSPYWYANLRWLTSQDRLETLAEYETRIGEDLHRFRTTFEPLLGVPLDVFAFPSGEFGQNGPLAAGGNPLTRLEAGHSNASDLQGAFSRALGRGGFRAAFAVNVPGTVHGATAQDGPYEFPRIGVGATFDPYVLDPLSPTGIELPEITSDDTFADCMAVAGNGSDLVTASTQSPELFWLTSQGRVTNAVMLEPLRADRGAHPSLVSAIVVRGDDVIAIQQAGWWPNATPYVNRLRVSANSVTVVSRTPLPPILNWIVGAIDLHGKIVAMDGRGMFFDIADPSPKALFAVSLPASESRHARFAGPALVGDRIYVYDRTLSAIEEIDERGDVLATTPLVGDIRSLASVGDDLLVVDWSAKRRIVRRFRVDRA